MTSREEKKRGWFRLWHLFAFTTGVAILIFMVQHVSFAVAFGREAGQYEYYFILRWDDKDVLNIDSFDDDPTVLPVFPLDLQP